MAGGHEAITETPSAINMPIQFHIGELKNVMAPNGWEKTIRKWPIPAEFQCFFMIGTRQGSSVENYIHTLTLFLLLKFPFYHIF